MGMDNPVAAGEACPLVLVACSRVETGRHTSTPEVARTQAYTLWYAKEPQLRQANGFLMQLLLGSHAIIFAEALVGHVVPPMRL